MKEFPDWNLDLQASVLGLPLLQAQFDFPRLGKQLSWLLGLLVSLVRIMKLCNSHERFETPGILTCIERVVRF